MAVMVSLISTFKFRIKENFVSPYIEFCSICMVFIINTPKILNKKTTAVKSEDKEKHSFFFLTESRIISIISQATRGNTITAVCLRLCIPVPKLSATPMTAIATCLAENLLCRIRI